MCGRTRQAFAAAAVYEHAQRDAGATRWRNGDTYQPTENVCPGAPAAVVAQAPDGGVEIVTMRWGLVPSYDKSEKPDYWKMFNARWETVHTSPVFSRSLKSRRCAVPASGFFEWVADEHKEVKSKQPYYVRRKSDAPMWLAGLFEPMTAVKRDDGADSGSLRVDCTFTLITRDVDRELAWLHDRMPVLLDAAGLRLWLDAEAAEPLSALQMRLPTADALTWHPTTKRMTKLDYQEADAASPVTLASQQQRSVASFFRKAPKAVGAAGSSETPPATTAEKRKRAAPDPTADAADEGHDEEKRQSRRPPADDAGAWEAQARELVEMGFADERANRAALASAKGDVSAAVAMLCSSG